jgi:hypothetical protein
LVVRAAPSTGLPSNRATTGAAYHLSHQREKHEELLAAEIPKVFHKVYDPLTSRFSLRRIIAIAIFLPFCHFPDGVVV